VARWRRFWVRMASLMWLWRPSSLSVWMKEMLASAEAMVVASFASAPRVFIRFILSRASYSPLMSFSHSTGMYFSGVWWNSSPKSTGKATTAANASQQKHPK